MEADLEPKEAPRRSFEVQARRFFEAYTRAFAAFDAEAIADCFHLPAMIASPDGAVVFQRRADLVANLEQVNAHHRGLGLARARLDGCRIAAVHAPSMLQVATRWEFLRADGSRIYAFPARYLLCRYGPDWAISAVLNVEG